MVNVIIQRYMEIDDGMGGKDYDWDNHLEIEGTLDQLSGDEVLASDKLGELSSHIFIIFEIVDVKRGDRFLVGDNKDIYNVTNVDNPNNMDRHLEIKLKYTGERYG
ncbi:phage head closure protein [Oceanobacillus luteolus]|uniref:phage head closure protein n=1 Tax=Oceanobacillus luteolus TaxID=1274358 RepID=UPI00203FFAB0|nr:phage head closure protein [Oceanobacillus luteolus]MCM3739233.1 phage head closure protein [Oceanobacillus luteolus]